MDIKEFTNFWETQLTKTTDKSHKLTILAKLYNQSKKIGMYEHALSYLKMYKAIEQTLEISSSMELNSDRNISYVAEDEFQDFQTAFSVLKNMYDFLPQNIIIVKENGEILYANHAFLHFNHLAPDAVKKISLSGMLEDFEQNFIQMKKHVEEHSFWRGKLLHKRKQNDFHWADVSCFPFQIINHEKLYVIMQTFEVKDSLPEEYPFLTKVLENPFEVGIVLLNDLEQVVYANSYAFVLTQWSNETDLQNRFHFLWKNLLEMEKNSYQKETQFSISHNLDNTFYAFGRWEEINNSAHFLKIIIFEDATSYIKENIPLSVLKQISRLNSLGITISNTAGNILFVNSVEAKMHYFKSSELIGKDVGIFSNTRKPMKIETIKNLKGIIRESVNYRKDGSVFPISLFSDVITDNLQQPVAIITCSEDLSEKKNIHEDLVRFSTHLKSDNEVIYSESIDGFVISWNQKAEAFFGYSAAEIKGKSSSMLIPPEHLSELEKIEKNIRKHGFVEDFETYRLSKYGNRIYVSLTITPLRNKLNKIIGYSTVVKDITDKNLYMRKLEHLNGILRAWREIDYVIQRESSPANLMSKIADLLVQFRSYKNVWIYLLNSKQQLIKTFFSGSAESIQDCQKTKQIPACLGKCLYVSETLFMNKPEKECGECSFPIHRKNQQLMFVRLAHGEHVFGLICVSVTEKLIDNQEEKEIFQDIAQDISFALYNLELEKQRKKMRQALHESEIKFRKLFENSHDAIFLHDLEGKIIDANGNAAKMIGLPLEKLKELNLIQLFSEKSQVYILRSLSNLNQEDSFECEAAFERVDGLVIDVLLSEKLVDEEKGISQAILRDITNEKWAEEALESNLTLLQTLLETIPNPLFYKDVSGVYLGCNTAYCEYIGFSKEEIIGRTAKQLLGEEQSEIMRQYEIETMEKGQRIIEASVPYANGTMHQVITTYNSFHWQNEQVGGVVGVMLDITKRKEIEEALKESEQKYKLLTEDLKDIVLKLTPQAELEYVSPAIKEFAGYEADEALHKNVGFYFMNRNEFVQAIKYFRRAISRHEDFSLEFLFKAKNREHFYVEISGHPIQKQDRIVSLQCVMRDISERKLAEEQKKQLYHELELVNQELKDFAYIVSHDLKAPLRGIHSLATWISSDYADVFDEDGKEQMDLLMNRVNRMHDLIEGILQYSRVGRVHEDNVRIDLQKLVPEIIDLLSPPPHFSIEIETELPEIIAEKTRITQVFQNLISNAIKYNDKEAGKIQIGCHQENNFWKCYVKDNGPGIDKKHHETIFKIFQTLYSKDDYESTGIGLTVVKRIVEMYGGKIWVESEVGKGTAFYFTMPISRKE